MENAYSQVDPVLKAQAESILNALGLPVSTAIDMFYKQIILKQGLPFDVVLPSAPCDTDNMTAEQFHAEIQLGLDDIKAGRVIPAEEVFERLHRDIA